MTESFKSAHAGSLTVTFSVNANLNFSAVELLCTSFFLVFDEQPWRDGRSKPTSRSSIRSYSKREFASAASLPEKPILLSRLIPQYTVMKRRTTATKAASAVVASSACVVFLLLLLSSCSLVAAFPTGAGGCSGAQGSVGGPHLTPPDPGTVNSASLEASGLQVFYSAADSDTQDLIPFDLEGVPAGVPTSANLILVLAQSGSLGREVPFKGFLFRLSDSNGTDTASYLSVSPSFATESQIAQVCTAISIGGVVSKVATGDCWLIQNMKRRTYEITRAKKSPSHPFVVDPFHLLQRTNDQITKTPSDARR